MKENAIYFIVTFLIVFSACGIAAAVDVCILFSQFYSPNSLSIFLSQFLSQFSPTTKFRTWKQLLA